MCDAMSGTIIEGLLKRVADIEKERDEAYAERDLHIRAAGLMGREIERLMGLIDALTANPALNSADQYARLADTLEPAVFAPTDAAQAREAALHPDAMLPEAIRLIRQEATRDHSQEVVTGLKHIALLLEQLIKEART